MAQLGKIYRATVELEIRLDAECLSYSDDHLGSAKAIISEVLDGESWVKVLSSDLRFIKSADIQY